MHVTSLPGPYGVGDLGPVAHRWIDVLARARQGWWQILPLQPPGSGHSPYQCFSAFAGNPILINPDLLLEDELVVHADISQVYIPAPLVNFERASRSKAALLARAWTNFQSVASRSLRQEFERFKSVHSSWLPDYALFVALKNAQPNMEWTRWPKALVLRKPDALKQARRELASQIEHIEFIQFLFFRQLDLLKKYAHSKGVRIIGDVPIFVSAESADVWASPHLFLLDKNRRPKVVAGVPPDYFSKTGQRRAIRSTTGGP